MIDKNSEVLIIAIQGNYAKAQDCIDNTKPNDSAQYIRATLENVVKLFYNKAAIGNIPAQSGKIDLIAAIANYKFAKNFTHMTKSDMQGIRQVTANVLAGTQKISLSEATDLLYRLKSCINIVGEKLDIDILHDNKNLPTPTTYKTAADFEENETEPSPTEIEKSMSETEKFWEAFNDLLMENGEPFKLTIDGDNAIIDKNNYATLKIEFTPTLKYFIVSIYTTNRASWNTLNSHKADINSQLAQKPVWGSTTTTCYIQSKSASAFYDNIPYKQIIEDILADTEIYLDILNQYSIPEDTTMLQPIASNQPILPKPLVANLSRGYGGRAQTVYDAGCNTFGWDRSKRGNFSMMKLLYATHATPEDYSVWCLCNIAQKVISNNRISWMNVDSIFNNGKNWANILLSDGSLIYEIWKDIGPAFPGYCDDMTTRVTFLKYKDTKGEYVFAGIYKPVKTEDKVMGSSVYHIKVYERIADTYGE